MMQLIEEETVKYSEILKKISLHGSLTYWKLKNKGFENCNTILKIKVLKGKTSYRPLSNIRRIERNMHHETKNLYDKVADHYPT